MILVEIHFLTRTRFFLLLPNIARNRHRWVRCIRRGLPRASTDANGEFRVRTEPLHACCFFMCGWLGKSAGNEIYPSNLAALEENPWGSITTANYSTRRTPGRMFLCFSHLAFCAAAISLRDALLTTRLAFSALAADFFPAFLALAAAVLFPLSPSLTIKYGRGS